jgi:hypothetical protein
VAVLVYENIGRKEKNKITKIHQSKGIGRPFKFQGNEGLVETIGRTRRIFEKNKKCIGW